MPKYQTNAHGLYDCRDPNCERRGSKGFNDPRAAGVHARHAHGLVGQTTLARKSAIVKAERPVKRPEARRSGRDEAPLTLSASDLNYCPRCGTSLIRMKETLAPDVQVAILSRCPQCNVGLSAVMAALNLMVNQDPVAAQRVFVAMLGVMGGAQ